MYTMMMPQGHKEGNHSDVSSYTSSSGSDSGSTEASTAADSQSLGGHVEDARTSQCPQDASLIRESSVAWAPAKCEQDYGAEQKDTIGAIPILGHEESEAARANASMGASDQTEIHTDKEGLVDRSEVVRRLSRSVLASSSNTLTHVADKDSSHLSHGTARHHMNHAATAGHRSHGTSSDAAKDNDEPSSLQQSPASNDQALNQESERPDGRQARLQLEDMLTRIELHFQAEKSARLEAEARCAAALEALRRAGHPHSQLPAVPAPRQLPKSVVERAREGITAAHNLVTSVCTIHDEIQVVRQSAHHIQAMMNNLLQELPMMAEGPHLSQEYAGTGAVHHIAMGTAQPQAVQPDVRGWLECLKLEVGNMSNAAAQGTLMSQPSLQAAESTETCCIPETSGSASASYTLVKGLARQNQLSPNMGPGAVGGMDNSDSVPLRSKSPVRSLSPVSMGLQQQGNFPSRKQGPRAEARPFRAR